MPTGHKIFTRNLRESIDLILKKIAQTESQNDEKIRIKIHAWDLDEDLLTFDGFGEAADFLKTHGSLEIKEVNDPTFLRDDAGLEPDEVDQAPRFILMVPQKFAEGVRQKCGFLYATQQVDAKEQSSQHDTKPPADTHAVEEINLSEAHVSFIEGKSQLVINETVIQLPSFKQEHYVCKRMFADDVYAGTAVSWDEIYELMEPRGVADVPAGASAKIKNAVHRLNGRISQGINLDSTLFVWRNKSVIRNK